MPHQQLHFVGLMKTPIHAKSKHILLIENAGLQLHVALSDTILDHMHHFDTNEGRDRVKIDRMP